MLIFSIFFDIIFIQVIQAVFTGNANLIASATVLLIQQDKDVLEELGIDPEMADWDFQDWFSAATGGNSSGGSGWVVDKNLLVRQKTMYIFEKCTEGTFVQSIPYAMYGVGLCEAGPTAWYDYQGISVQDADPIINLVGTGKSYNQKQAIDQNLWIFNNNGQTPAIGPFQFVGVYGQNKMRYQVDMTYDGAFNVTDLLNGAVNVGDKQNDEVEFARPNPLYIPDAVYSYAKGMDAVYAQRDFQRYFADMNQLSTEQQALMRTQIAMCLYGWGEGNVNGKYEQNGHSLVTFSTALGNWMKAGHNIADIVDYKQYWNANELRSTYTKQDLKTWCESNLGITITKEAQQGTYVEMEGLYHVVAGYVEWMNLKDAIAAAEKQGGGDGNNAENFAGREKVVAIAKDSLGKFTYKSPGSLKGTGPDNFTVGSTLDCQSWIQWCYWQAGFQYQAGWTGAYSQASDLIEIKREDVQIADLQVVYPSDSPQGIGHVWMYIGDGKWAECTPTGGTRGDNWSNKFMNSNPSHFFTYSGFGTSSGGSGESGGSSGATGNWQNPVPGYTGISRRYISKQSHGALDIVAPLGTPIYAAADGTVVAVESGWSGGTAGMASYGNYVNLDNGGGIYTMYAHMVQTAVGPGAQVKAGDCIGYLGQTGNSSGPHLHFEIRVGGNSSAYREDPDNLQQYGIPSYLGICPNK